MKERIIMAKKKKEEDVNKIKPEDYSPRQMMNTANTTIREIVLISHYFYHLDGAEKIYSIKADCNFKSY